MAVPTSKLLSAPLVLALFVVGGTVACGGRAAQVVPPHTTLPFSIVRQFVRANVDEVSGKPEEALEIYRSLDKQLKKSKDTSPFVLKRVQAAMKRLSH